MKMLTVVSEILVLAVVATAQQENKPHVFVKESVSSEVWGEAGGFFDVFGGHIQGGARPQTAEIIKTFRERCPGVVVTTNKEKADYVVLLEHEGGKGIIVRDNKYALF